MTFDVETIYGLLPAVYRTRDAAIAESQRELLTPAERAQLESLRAALLVGSSLDESEQRDLVRLEEKRLRGPLKALVAIIAEQVAGLEENIEQLYDDQFIETCAPWAVPYIGDLVAHRPLEPRLQERLRSARAEVANTIRFRRRRGTAAVLEELAIGLTGWDAAVVEHFLRLATTQHVNHVRLDHQGTVDLRDVEALERVDTAFDRQVHSADVRRADGAPRHNLPNVDLFLWRQASRRLTDAPTATVDARRRLFDALGADVQLYHAAERAPDVARLAEPLDVALPVTRRSLQRGLTDLYGPGRSFSISVGGDVLDADAIEACDLSDDPAGGWIHRAQAKVAVDPELGRIAFPGPQAETVRVTYHYAGVGEFGAGEYDRAPATDTSGALERHVPADRSTIALALEDLDGAGTVEIRDSDGYEAPPALIVAEDSRLVVRAANGSRPLLRLSGDLVVGGGDSGEITLDGFVITGGRIIVPDSVDGHENSLQRLRLRHCTLVPGAGVGLEVLPANVTVEIERSIVGALRVTESSIVALSGSILDGLAPTAVAYEAPGGGPGGPLSLDACTTIGKIHAAELTASDSILHAALAEADPWLVPVVAKRGQVGYVRYSYVPLEAQLPRRFECRPREAREVSRMVPRFTSLEYGQPGYFQLHDGCPRELRCGAADGGEMGVHHDLYAPQRVAVLRARMDEFLRFGLEAGVIFAS